MKFNIIGRTKLWVTLSSIMIAIGLFGLISNTLTKGMPMNFGRDFTGGTGLTIRFGGPVDLGEIRAILIDHGEGESMIQRSEGYDINIASEPLTTEERQKIIEDIKAKFTSAELLEADTIGPVVGKELRAQAFWALLVATIGMLIYVAFRFEFKYGIASIVALAHDALITVGFIALLWRTVDTAFIAAILTILGYSINDTIVIFDRIRENMLKPGSGKRPFADVVNEALNQTLARSINTGLAVIFMTITLLLFGGATIKDFALTLFIGFTIGAYSSLFVASPLIVLFDKWEKGK